MKKILAVVTITCIILLSFFTITSLAQKKDPHENVTYSNEEHRFTVSYPTILKLKPIRLLPYEIFHIGRPVPGIPSLIVSAYEMEGSEKLELDGFFGKIKELYPKAEFKKKLTEEQSKVLSDGTPAKIYTFAWDWPVSGNRKFMGFQFCIGNTDTLVLKSAVLISSKNGKHYSCLFTTSRIQDVPLEWLAERVVSFDFY